MTTIQTAQPNDVQRLRNEGKPVRLIDVRSPAEFESVHATDALLVPLDTLDPDRLVTEHGIARDEPLYMICKMGGRSQRACEKLASAGFSNVTNVAGGTDAWVQAGLPVERGERKTIAVNRQVQILAGSLALIGALLSFVNPMWAWLAAFIGGGLVFSGVTNTCGMGTVLAKMPWNQASKPWATAKPMTESLPVAAGGCDTGG